MILRGKPTRIASGSTCVLPCVWDLSAFEFDRGAYHQVATICARFSQAPHKDIHFATVGPVMEECTHKMFLKLARDERANDVLKHEYEMYNTHLIHLQGTVIPRCYGYFKGKHKGKTVGCLVLEICVPDKHNSLSKEEFNRQIMECMCKIHAARIEHGGLGYAEPHHFVKMGMSPSVRTPDKDELRANTRSRI
ncbi:hypothetical protein BDZ97DRAFT_1769180 [Flammula alnicola]|nr:hypothetical protein BDZ97DRAFT_1769180 [Flammula alnicola]